MVCTQSQRAQLRQARKSGNPSGYEEDKDDDKSFPMHMDWEGSFQADICFMPWSAVVIMLAFIK